MLRRMVQGNTSHAEDPMSTPATARVSPRLTSSRRKHPRTLPAATLASSRSPKNVAAPSASWQGSLHSSAQERVLRAAFFKRELVRDGFVRELREGTSSDLLPPGVLPCRQRGEDFPGDLNRPSRFVSLLIERHAGASANRRLGACHQGGRPVLKMATPWRRCLIDAVLFGDAPITPPSRVPCV